MNDRVSKTDEWEPHDEATAPPEEEGMDEAPPEGDDGELEALEAEAGADELAVDDLAGSLESALDGEMAALRTEFEGLNDRHLRLAAEFNNYRRRVEQERLDTWGRAQADLLAKLLDVLDDLQRVAGLDLTNATMEGIMEGIDLVERKFTRVLADVGLEIIDPVGAAFDPAVMEAMMRQPAESEDDDDRVAQVFQKGYRLKGQLVRPARVGVYKHG
jgi:molecular chaperone GrpE